MRASMAPNLSGKDKRSRKRKIQTVQWLDGRICLCIMGIKNYEVLSCVQCAVIVSLMTIIPIHTKKRWQQVDYTADYACTFVAHSGCTLRLYYSVVPVGFCFPRFLMTGCQIFSWRTVTSNATDDGAVSLSTD